MWDWKNPDFSVMLIEKITALELQSAKETCKERFGHKCEVHLMRIS
jgi:hypothetical protein